MHGAGREDITTTLNNCYVVAVKDDSIKSIYTAMAYMVIKNQQWIDFAKILNYFLNLFKKD